MSAAQCDLVPLEFPDEHAAGAVPESEAEAAASPSALKEQVAQRLAAHRARRGQTSVATAITPIAKASPGRSRSARIAAAVAERYANSPSYRAFLAAEAENAIRQAEAAQREAEAAAREAEAAASVAAISAQAVADAQYELLAELDQWTLTPPPTSPHESTFPGAASPHAGAVALASSSVARGQGLTVRIYEDPVRPAPPPISNRSRSFEPLDEEEGYALDEEIAFRQAPVFDDFRIVPSEIPANLIEFPRQLVAARRARPRLAEGPLREDSDHSPEAAQLRIFEVEAAQISTIVPPAVESAESAEPEWTSILLAAHPVSRFAASAEGSLHPVFSTQFATQAAPLRLRMMASAVDVSLVTLTFAASGAAFVYTLGKISGWLYANHPMAALSRPMALQTGAIGTLVTLAFLMLLYQVLFFTFSDATPGMRYARIALCTFDDENPSRRSMRRRIIAVLLAACPLGLGFLWAWLDDEGLGWHDRISRMYQRSY
jgi:uncharacterized RDD family membrane protein YckC/multidrug efflux pump subunit AcrA (membrane-fusion protein)